MVNNSWHPIRKEGLPKEDGWYLITIHESDWVSGESWIPENEWSHFDAEAIVAIAKFSLLGVSPHIRYNWLWSGIRYLSRDDGELCKSLHNTCVIERKTGPGTQDAEIVAWAQIPLLDSPYTNSDN